MKLHNILIMIFCLFAGAALVVTLHLRSTLSSHSLEAQWQATVADLYDNSSAAHTQSLRYESYARQAATENDLVREQLFHALAYSERIHEQLCAKAARVFGGDYVAPDSDEPLPSSTVSNLQQSISEALLRHHRSQGAATTRAIESGNRYVARILIWIDGGNRRHIELLKQAAPTQSTTLSEEGYLVCPKCGNTYHTSSYDAYCPFCQTHHEEFRRFAPQIK